MAYLASIIRKDIHITVFTNIQNNKLQSQAEHEHLNAHTSTIVNGSYDPCMSLSALKVEPRDELLNDHESSPW